jgi:hypothetical protein
MPTAEVHFMQIEDSRYSIAGCTKITFHTSLLSISIRIEDEKKEARVLQVFSDFKRTIRPLCLRERAPVPIV